MKNQKAQSAVITVALAALVGGQAQASLNVQLFNPSMSSSYTLTEDALSKRLADSVQFGASYNYVNRPLVEVTQDRKDRLGDVISSINTINMTGGYYFGNRVFLGADLPVNMITMPGKAEQFALGDTRLMSKIRVSGDFAPVDVALIPELFIPTGDRGMYVSDGAFGAGLKGAIERQFGRITVSGNLGYRYSGNSTFKELEYRNRISAGIGGNLMLSSKWALNAEGQGTILLPRNAEQNPGEVYLGARYSPRSNLNLALGGSLGAINGVGSSDYRIVAGLTFVADTPKAPAIVVAPKPAPVVVAAPKPAPTQAPRVFYEHKQIRVTEEVKFKHDSSELAPSGMNLLDEVAQVIKKNEKFIKKLTIEGHTNKIGSDKYNLKLSKERAASVKEYLMSRGVAESLLDTVGYGESRPKKIANLSKIAQLNADRRVEFKVKEFSKVELAVRAKKEALKKKPIRKASQTEVGGKQQ